MIKYSHKIFIVLLASLLVNSQLFSQLNKSAPSYLFHSYNSVQLLNGGSTVSASVHSVNGWQKGKLFAGVGAGFDYYYHRSVPLFLEARYNLLGTQRKLQLYANGGIHIPYGNKNTKETWKAGDFKTGRLLATGIDYFIPIKKDALIVGVAYSQKTIIQMVDNNIWNPILNRIENEPIKEAYEFNRVWIKLGWVF